MSETIHGSIRGSEQEKEKIKHARVKTLISYSHHCQLDVGYCVL